MEISRFTDSQIMQILKQAESGISAPALCREHGMSNATFYKWRAKYGGMDASMVSRLKELEDENRRLKKWLPKYNDKPMYSRRRCQKRGEAVFAPRDGYISSADITLKHSCCLCGV